MELSVEITQDMHGTIAITDYTKNPEFARYLDEDAEEFSQGFTTFKYSKTMSITSLFYEPSTGEEVVKTVFTPHDRMPSIDETADSVRIPIDKDGYYIVYHIVLPTLDWLENDVYDNENLKQYNHIYVTDGSNILKYDLSSHTAYIVDIKEVAELNSCYSDDYKGTISKANFDIFSTVKLKECFIRLSRDLFNYCPDNCQRADSQLRFRRDFIWMTYNVITFYLQDHMYIDAQNILELTTGCNSFCENESKSSLKNADCGCRH